MHKARATLKTNVREETASKLRDIKVNQLMKKKLEHTEDEIDRLRRIEEEIIAEEYNMMEEDEMNFYETEAIIYETTKNMTQEELNDFLSDNF